MRRPGGIRRTRSSRQFRGHDLDHWRGRATAAGRSADRNNGGPFAQPGRIARQFGLDGADDVSGAVRALPAARHRDPRFPGSSSQRGVHRPVAVSPVRKGALKMRMGHRMAVVVAVLAAVVVAGCGSGGGTGSGGSGSTPVGATAGNTSASASLSKNSSGANVAVTIAAGKVAPDPSRKVEVATGDHVHLSVTSDHADEVHVHGYDIEKEVSAGGTVTIDFTADIPGQFEVEAHKLSPSLLFTLVVK
jgi:hypothetical protein